jgi:hypothetical protein
MMPTTYNAGWSVPPKTALVYLSEYTMAARGCWRGNICYFSKWACGIAPRLVYIPAASVIVSQEVRLFTNLAAISGMWVQEQYRPK